MLPPSDFPKIVIAHCVNDNARSINTVVSIQIFKVHFYYSFQSDENNAAQQVEYKYLVF